MLLRTGELLLGKIRIKKETKPPPKLAKTAEVKIPARPFSRRLIIFCWEVQKI